MNRETDTYDRKHYLLVGSNEAYTVCDNITCILLSDLYNKNIQQPQKSFLPFVGPVVQCVHATQFEHSFLILF